MRPTKAYVALAMLLAAGCASSPEVTDEAVIAAPALAAARKLRKFKRRNRRS